MGRGKVWNSPAERTAEVAKQLKRVKKLGRPRKYETPEALDLAIDAYIAECVAEEEPILKTGMLLYLGFVEENAIDQLAKRHPSFEGPVKRARKLVENAYERRLATATAGGASVGAMFALKNMGWMDERSIKFQGVLAGVNLTELMRHLPDDLVGRVASGEDLVSVLASAEDRIRGLLTAPRAEPGG
jgi:hypothetical protein